MGALISLITDRLASPTHDLTPLSPHSIYLITGGLTGLGYETTLHLAQRGATVFVTARSLPRAQSTLNKLEADYPLIKGRVILVDAVVDLSTFAKARAGGEAVVAAIEAHGGRLDAVCLNAARLPTDGGYEIGENGFELIMATNYFGNHIFLSTILPLLEKRAREPDSDVRIVWISSRAQEFVPRDWKFDGAKSLNQTFASSEKNINSLQPGLIRCGLSKLLAIPYLIELQSQFDTQNLPITTLSLNPGTVATEKSYLSLPQSLSFILHFLGLPPFLGSITYLFALTSREIAEDRQKWKARYLVPFGKVSEPHWKGADDPLLGRKLWEYTMGVVERGGAEVV